MTRALNSYGEQASLAAAEMFDDAMQLEGLGVTATVPSGIISRAEVERIARYQAGKVVKGDVNGFVEQVAESTGYLTRQAANRTMLAQSGGFRTRDGTWTMRNGRFEGDSISSVKDDGTLNPLPEQMHSSTSKARRRYRWGKNPRNGYQVRYARIPQGMETCDFCLMLCSRGFVYHSAEAAGADDPDHYHRGCDCLVIAGAVHFTDGEMYQDTEIEGYDPDAIFALWQEVKDMPRNDESARAEAMERIIGRSEW